MTDETGDFDLVGRLWTEFANDPNSAAGEAADRIQRLEAENERLRTQPTLDEVAEVMRTAEFAMSRALTAAIAVGGRPVVDAMHRDLDRLLEAKRQVKAMLKRLPPKPPMTPERMEKVGAVVTAALRKWFGEGTEEEVGEAVNAWLAHDRATQTGSSAARDV